MATDSYSEAAFRRGRKRLLSQNETFYYWTQQVCAILGIFMSIAVEETLLSFSRELEQSSSVARCSKKKGVVPTFLRSSNIGPTQRTKQKGIWPQFIYIRLLLIYSGARKAEG